VQAATLVGTNYLDRRIGPAAAAQARTASTVELQDGYYGFRPTARHTTATDHPPPIHRRICVDRDLACSSSSRSSSEEAETRAASSGVRREPHRPKLPLARVRSRCGRHQHPAPNELRILIMAAASPVVVVPRLVRRATASSLWSDADLGDTCAACTDESMHKPRRARGHVRDRRCKPRYSLNRG